MHTVPHALSPPKPHQFRCAACGGVYDKALTDAEAREQFDWEFPGQAMQDVEVVCEDCYGQMKASGLFDEPPHA